MRTRSQWRGVRCKTAKSDVPRTHHGSSKSNHTPSSIGTPETPHPPGEREPPRVLVPVSQQHQERRLEIETRFSPNNKDGDGGPRICLMPFLVNVRRTSQMRLATTKLASNGRDVSWDMCKLWRWLNSVVTDAQSRLVRPESLKYQDQISIRQQWLKHLTVTSL